MKDIRTTDILVVISSYIQIIRFPDVQIKYHYLGIDEHISYIRFNRWNKKVFMYRIRIKYKEEFNKKVIA